MSETRRQPSATVSRTLVEELSAASGEPGWLRERRLAAWEAFVRLPLPSATDEDWRRTDVSALDLDAFGVLPYRVEEGQPPAGLAGLIGDAGRHDGLRLTVNGAQIQSRLTEDLARQGVVFSSLSDAVRKHPDLVRPHLGTVVRTTRTSFGRSMARCGAVAPSSMSRAGSRWVCSS